MPITKHHKTLASSRLSILWTWFPQMRTMSLQVSRFTSLQILKPHPLLSLSHAGPGEELGTACRCMRAGARSRQFLSSGRQGSYHCPNPDIVSVLLALPAASYSSFQGAKRYPNRKQQAGGEQPVLVLFHFSCPSLLAALILPGQNLPFVQNKAQLPAAGVLVRQGQTGYN